jgi:HSP20 family protein
MRMLNPVTTHWLRPRTLISPSLLMGDVFEDLDRMMNRVTRPVDLETPGFLPLCDVEETKNHYLVSFDMPGVKKENINIEVKGSWLKVSGERQPRSADLNRETSIRSERNFGKFERTFELPAAINAEKIEAQYENGVLSVAVPKAEAEKGRTVQIQGGEASFFEKLLGTKHESQKELKDVKVS